MCSYVLSRKKGRKMKQSEKGNREEALELLRGRKTPFRKIEQIKSVSRGMLGRMKRADDEGDETALEKLLNPQENHAGRNRVLSASAEKKICERMVFAAS